MLPIPHPSATARSVPPPKILIVDDLPSNLAALEALLSGVGSTLVKASSGAEALKHLLGEDFALILLDVQMPELDGFETARLIREREACDSVPIVFLTAIHKDPAQVSKGYALGAVDYLFKPLDPILLKAKVRTFVDLAQRTQELRATVEEEQRAREEEYRLNAELERRVQERTAALEEAQQRKDRFLAMLGHELRNPLGAMSNALHVLAGAPKESVQFQRALAVLKRQVEHQRCLVDDLLDVNRLTHGRITLEVRTLDMCKLLVEVTEELRPVCDVCSLTLDLQTPGHPVWVRADPVRITQVVANLLDNAIKFSAPGGTVTVCTDTSTGSTTVAVCVRDTGVGIREEDLPHLFEPLYQADVSLDRSRGGLGLGLALCRQLVELHGGELSATSAGEGQGAEFRFTLPLAEAPPTDSSTPEDAPRRAELRILVVEDNRDAAETLRDLLEYAGHTVAVALNGPEGIATALQFQPDVVLCDLGLPQMDGFDVAEALKQEPRTAGVHLIALSGYGQPEDLERSREAGFTLHFVKPVDPRSLEEALCRLAGEAASV